MANSWYKKDALTITKGDTLRSYQATSSDSPATLERSFCGQCGSPIMLQNQTEYPDLVVITTGTMDGGSVQEWKPQMELYCRRKPGWLQTPDETKKFQGGLGQE
ncbi:hypothetical protein EYZ11_009025 [Aspergillus tanneri]|nr:hypothetical protein EYZ11_009025 [Aspergillus tanneri]